MCQVIALPRLIQTEFLAINGPANELIDEAFLGHGKLVFRSLLQNFRWHSNQIGFEDKTVEKLFEAADAGSQDEEKTIAFG